jgi:TraY domain
LPPGAAAERQGRRKENRTRGAEIKMTEEQAKRVQISVHLDEPLREQLEAAAKRSIRSLSGEAAYRIRQSLESEQSAA